MNAKNEECRIQGFGIETLGFQRRYKSYGVGVECFGFGGGLGGFPKL